MDPTRRSAKANAKPGTRQVRVQSHGLPASTPEEEDFRAFYERTYSRLFAIAEKQVGFENAKDVLQNIMTRTWKRFDEMTLEQRSLAAMSTAVARECITFRRRNREMVSLDEAEETGIIPAEQPVDPAEAAEKGELLRRVVDLMPEKRREIFLLKRDTDFTYAEIAESVGCRIETVRTQLRRAVGAVRERLGVAGYALPAPATRKAIRGAAAPRALPASTDREASDE